MRARRLSLGAAALLFFSSASAAVHELCPRVVLTGDDPVLTEVEKRLVCGNPDSEGWKDIPLNEARHFLRAFLQRRGFHYPRFEAYGDRLSVAVGTKTYVTRLTGQGLEGLVDLGKKRGVIGKPLTPAELDRLKSDLTARLQEQGHACPTVEVTADARTGEVGVRAHPGAFHTLAEIRKPPIDKLDYGIFNRFQAHQYGDPFDIRLLNLASERIVQEALFQSAYYEVLCSSAELIITQRVVEAKPRLITIGFGMDSEGYGRGRIQWRHSRIGYRASSAQATLFASYREQQIDAFMRYFLRPSDRLHLIPRFTASRSNEVQYESLESEISLSPAWTYDDARVHLEVQGGPALEYFKTVRGRGPVDDNFFIFHTRVIATSHLFEYFQRDPRTGWQAGMHASSRIRGAHSSISAQRLRLFGEKLWNVGRFDPPWLVLAARGWAGTLAVTDAAQAYERLPPTERFFLGGDVDLRGADRKELPYDGAGFISAAYSGLELRLNDMLPFKLQPLLFVDGALGGRRQFHLDRDIYYSPGAGLRWPSPVGTFRFTAARGLLARRSHDNPSRLPHWQFFVSFGSEF